MKNHFFLLSLICTSLFSYAQNTEPCYVPKITATVKESLSPNLSISQDSVIRIPVVVHVIYHDASENLSDSIIMHQIEYSTNDYRRLNADTIDTPDDFKPYAADAKIEFCLASQDPDGNSTSGITRTYTDSLTFIVGAGTTDPMKYDSSGGKDAWNTDYYLNIWIANITGATGYASNPMAHGQADDGIVMAYSSMNGINFLSHEIAHYLDLMHIYGPEGSSCENNDGGDLVSDTPDQYTSTHNCPSFPQTDACTSTYPGIMFMNFMDQTDVSCRNLFTQGQVDRMRNTLGTLRSLLLSSQGCSSSSKISSVKNENTVIKIQPNPFNSSTTIEFENRNGKSYTLFLYNSLGKMVKSISNVNSGLLILEKENLSNGLYYFQLNDSKNCLGSGKLIIE